MKCRAWWMAHASNLGTREAEAGGSARFQSSQGYEVRRYLKKIKCWKHVSPWFVSGRRKRVASRIAGSTGPVTETGDALRARGHAQFPSLAPIGCS